MSLPAPYWQSPDGRHVIYCADCLTVLPHFIGVEIEPKYCAIAVERMERELSQPCLPTMEPSAAKQEVLL